MENQALIKYLRKLLYDLCTIATKGEDTVTMGNSLVLLQQLINSLDVIIETKEIPFSENGNEIEE